MFAFTKEQKQRKLLKQLTKSYTDLEKDRENYILDNTDPEDLIPAKLSKFDLELLRIATIYDELKDQFPGFNKLRKGEHWKLDKPTESEGTVFRLYPEGTELYHDYVNSVEYSYFVRGMSSLHADHIERSRKITKKPLKLYLRKALDHREDEYYRTQCHEVIKRFGILDCDEKYLDVTASFLDHMSTVPKRQSIYHINIPISLDLQKQIAKAAKQNLLL